MEQKRVRVASFPMAVLSLGLSVSAVSVPTASAAPTGSIAPSSLPSHCAGDVTVVSCTFHYDGTTGADGTPQSFTVPDGVRKLTIEAWGAQGGTASYVDDVFDPPVVGGLGGYAVGTVPVTPGEILQVNVGGQPMGTAGGFNGGGAAGPATAENVGEAGGGATDARLGGDGLTDRVVVAGGGGGEAENSDEEYGSASGGAGGGTAGAPSSCSGSPCGAGGTATAGGAAGSPASPCAVAGSLGQGGSGCGGGGGGGYYGGGGGAFDPGSGPASPALDGPGGGGSGYVSPLATAASTVGGLQFGNGLLRISYTTTHPVAGLHWSAPRPIDATTGGLSSVSCADGDFCAAVDTAGRAMTYDGHWSKPVKVANGALSAVSCSSRAFCIAVGSAVGSNNEGGPLVAMDRRGVWTSSTGPVAGFDEVLTGVSCVSPSFCVASGTYYEGGAPGNTAFVQTFDGHSWTVVFDQDLTGYANGDSMAGVSCSSTLFCVAVGIAGDRGDVGGLVDVDTDGTWVGTQISDDRAGSFDGSGGLSAIACSAVNSCLAAGPSGYVYSNHGSGWTVGIGDPQSTVTALSCPDTSTCLAVDGAGNMLVNERGDWEVARSVDPGHALSSLSCPTSQFCVTVDTAGRVVIGRP